MTSPLANPAVTVVRTPRSLYQSSRQKEAHVHMSVDPHRNVGSMHDLEKRERRDCRSDFRSGR